MSIFMKIIYSNIRISKSVFLIALGITFLSLPSARLHAQDEYGDDNMKFHQQIYKDQHKIGVKIKESVNDIIEGRPVEIEGEYIFSKSIKDNFEDLPTLEGDNDISSDQGHSLHSESSGA